MGGASYLLTSNLDLNGLQSELNSQHKLLCRFTPVRMNHLLTQNSSGLISSHYLGYQVSPVDPHSCGNKHLETVSADFCSCSRNAANTIYLPSQRELCSYLHEQPGWSLTLKHESIIIAVSISLIVFTLYFYSTILFNSI